MASSSLPRRRNSMDIPPAIADVFQLRDEFMKLYERDQLQLQQCTEELRKIIKTFETDFRGSTEGSRKAGVAGIFGGASLLTGLGLGAGIALAPFTLGASAVIAGAGAAGVGAVTLTDAGIKSAICSSKKKEQVQALRKGIESELKKFQDKIKPMAEKMKDIHERTEKIVRDFQTLAQGADDLSKYFNRRNIRLEDLTGLTVQMNQNMGLIAAIAEIYGGFRLVLDMIC